MATPEERDQLIMTYCAKFRGTANNMAQHCDVLLANGNDLFSDEQKTAIRRIQVAVQKFLSLLVETVGQVTVVEGWASKEPIEFDQLMASWIHDLRTPLNLVIGYALLFLQGGMGPLNNKQREAIEYAYELAQSLLPTITKLLKSSTQA